MLKVYNYDIVCQEIPDEITLALNISGCPNRCKGCHSPWLWEDTGEPLDEELLTEIIDEYRNDISCVCFMGGDANPLIINELAEYIKLSYKDVKTGWYSGREELPSEIELKNFDFIKLGPYKEELGALRSAATNQKFYKILNGSELHQIQFAPKNAPL